MNNDNILNLYEHNEETSSKVFDAFNEGEKRVAIVQATGTGKSYVALNLLLKYKDKKALYIVPSNAIIEHLKEIISKNNLSIEKDFPNLEFRTYQSLINLSREELSKLDVDLLVTDELHHLGAPVWGKRINDIVETHPDMLLFGMTAYTVRDRATAYERDMTNPETDELFSGKVVSYYDLCDAMIDGVLPKPIYKSAYINLESFAKELEKYLDDPKLSKKDYLECKKLIEDAKRQITKASGIKEMVRKNIKPNGKYIYFCPPLSEENKNDIDTIMNEVREWFSDYDVEFYKTTSKNQEQGKQNRDAFYNDLDLDGNSTKHKLRIMFAINQYNEGVHAPGVDGVILGRSTSSDIVFFEQIGRALSVKENTKEKYEEYQNLSRNKLLEIAKSQSIEVTSNMTKDEIIERLLLPVIIDLTNNIEYIEELENNLKDRVKEIQKSLGHNKREIKIRDLNFDIMVENKNLFEILRYVRDRLRPNTWELNYSLAKAYFEKYGDLEIPTVFKTLNGVDKCENGYNLGEWLNRQRQTYKNGKLYPERKKLLDQIGMRFDTKDNDEIWAQMYTLAKNHFEKYGSLERITSKYKTLNGIDKDEKGYNLGYWFDTQRRSSKKGKLSSERKELLEQIGMRFDTKDNDEIWAQMYTLAKNHFEKYGVLKIPTVFKTLNGIDKDEEGYNLGRWLDSQRQSYKIGKLSKERKKLLDQIGMRFDTKYYDEIWAQMYALAKNHFEKYGDLEISQDFNTLNGIDKDEDGYNLGYWLDNQRRSNKKGKLSSERKELLEQIGMRFDTKDNDEIWAQMYALAKNHFEKYGSLKRITTGYKTLNGIDKDEKGYNLGSWIGTQRTTYKIGKLSPERIDLLEQIGMVWEIRKGKIKKQKLCNEYLIPYEEVKNISYNELYAKTMYLLDNNIDIIIDGKLNPIYNMSNTNMQITYGISLKELIEKYKKKEK